MNAVAAVFGAADSHGTHAAVKTMLDRMAERGSGHRIVVAEGPAVLGASGRSPAFSNKPDRAMLAGDLQLANQAELRATLGLPAEAVDGAIALEAFCRWGVEAGTHLSGPFAMVILDRSESRLIAAPDALGIRPLYYRRGTAHVRVASELQALVEEGDVPDEGFLAEALAGGIVDREGTPYASIRRLPAGHALIADAGGARVQRYWEPPREPLSGTPDEHAERFQLAFDEAVEACCQGQGAVGVHLEGSVHSASILAAVAAREDTAPVAVSIVLPGAEGAANDLASIRRWLDLPDLPTGIPLLRPMCEPLKAQGITVLLSALGGDLWPRGESADSRGWTEAAGQVPQRVRRLFKAWMPRRVPDWIEPRFSKRVSLADRMGPQSGIERDTRRSWDDLRRRLESAEDILERDRADRLSVQSGVEVRHPFYDRRLVELAFATAAAGIAAGSHPAAAGTPVDAAGRLLVDALRGPEVEPLLGFPRLTELGWVRPDPLARLHQDALAGSQEAALALWKVLGVEAWLEQVFGGTPRDKA